MAQRQESVQAIWQRFLDPRPAALRSENPDHEELLVQGLLNPF